MQQSVKLVSVMTVLGLTVGVALGSYLSRQSPPPLMRVNPAPWLRQPKPNLRLVAGGTPVVMTPNNVQQSPSGPKVIQIPPPVAAAPRVAPAPRLAAPPAVLPAPGAPRAATGSFLVCIDPGHPSETSGGAHANGLSENRLNWQVALDIKAILDQWHVASVLTKSSENENVKNRRRAEIANGDNIYRRPANLFVRLHCDVGGSRGYTWYYPDRMGSKGGVMGPPVAVQRASAQAAQILNSAMQPVLNGYLRSNPIKTDASTFVGNKQGGVLTGSIFALVPTALIEMCYINQKADAAFIASDAGRQKMALALATGIVTYQRQTWR